MASEPAWWTQQKRACRLPTNLAYNDWVRSGSPCYGSGGNSGGSGSANNDDAARAAAEAAAAKEREAAEREERRKEAEERERQEQIRRETEFIESRDAAAATLKGNTGATVNNADGGLKGSSSASDAAGIKGTTSGATGLRGTLKGTDVKAPQPTPKLDPMVVDARKVPSGLPKSVDDAISSGYSGAPPGVSDRVRKGFQAVATHDWKVARAWFQDALNHDPNNAGLKRLVELADYTEKHIQRDTIHKSAKISSPSTPVQLPQDSDMELLFPGWEPAKARRSSTPAGTPMQLPEDSDIYFLFPGLPAIEARKMNDYMLDQAIKATANDPVLIKLSKGPAAKQPTIHAIPTR